ncbi:MAG: DUF3592 domain-containing protein [Planctomycetota bacterium]
MPKTTSSAAPFGILLFALFWCGIVGVFDVVIARQQLAELRARMQFEEVPARILSSSVHSSHDSEGGTSYAAKVSYEYRVAGQTYTSDRYAYTLWSSSDRDLAAGIVDEHPVGSSATAYVDPNDPTEAVLDVSGEAFPKLILLFLTPFHCVGIFLLGAFVHGFRRRRWTAEEVARDRFVHVDDDARFVLKRPRASASSVFLGTLLVTSFIAIFALAFGFGMGGASFLVLPVGVVCASASLWTALWHRSRGRSPENFLFVDRGRGLFSYPADALGERLDAVEGLQSHTAGTGMTVNDEPILRHTFEAIVDGRPHEVFRHRGPRRDGATIESLLRDVLGLPADDAALDAAERAA